MTKVISSGYGVVPDDITQNRYQVSRAGFVLGYPSEVIYQKKPLYQLYIMVLSRGNDFALFSFSKPLLTITVKKATPTAEEWEWTKQTMITFYQTIDSQGFRMSIIFDLRCLGIMELGIFKDWAELFQEYREYTKRCVYRTSIITDNLTIKIGLNLFFSLYTTVRPMKFASTLEEATQFVSETSVTETDRSDTETDRSDTESAPSVHTP